MRLFSFFVAFFSLSVGLAKIGGLILLFKAIYLNIYKIFLAAMTSRFHTVLQEVHLSTAWILFPAALDDIDRSRRFTKVLLWHSAHTCDVRYSSIITVDTFTLRLDSDFEVIQEPLRWCRKLAT